MIQGRNFDYQREVNVPFLKRTTRVYRVQNNLKTVISTVCYSSEEMISDSYKLNINIMRIIFPFE